MSADYFFYVEVKINNKWYCINPKYPHFKYDYKKYEVLDEYEYEQEVTYWNGSRSYFSATYEKLQEIGEPIRYSELSEELKTLYKNSCEAEENDEMLWCRPVAIDYDRLINYIKDDEYDSHGLVHKDVLFGYRNGDIEEIYPLDHEEVKELTPDEMKSYEYHEWDSWYGWSWGIKEVKRRAISNVRDFFDLNYMIHDYKIRVIMIGG